MGGYLCFQVGYLVRMSSSFNNKIHILEEQSIKELGCHQEFSPGMPRGVGVCVALKNNFSSPKTFPQVGGLMGLFHMLDKPLQNQRLGIQRFWEGVIPTI